MIGNTLQFIHFLVGTCLQTKYTKNKGIQIDEHSQPSNSQHYFEKVENWNPSVLQYLNPACIDLRTL